MQPGLAYNWCPLETVHNHPCFPCLPLPPYIELVKGPRLLYRRSRALYAPPLPHSGEVTFRFDIDPLNGDATCLTMIVVIIVTVVAPVIGPTLYLTEYTILCMARSRVSLASEARRLGYFNYDAWFFSSLPFPSSHTVYIRRNDRLL